MGPRERREREREEIRTRILDAARELFASEGVESVTMRRIAERIVAFARVVGRERVIAGADCGFAQGALYERQHPAVMWAKFESLAEGARLAYQRL